MADIAYECGYCEGYDDGRAKGRAEVFEEMKKHSDNFAEFDSKSEEYERGYRQALEDYHAEECQWETGCKYDFFKELTSPYDVKNMQEYKAAIRAEVIDEIKERCKPCYDCEHCLEENKKYFEKQCERETRIHYTKLCEYLEQLKAGGNE